MLLGTTRGSSNIPEGGISLTKEEALNHQRILIDNWPSYQDVFFLRFGRYITTATTFLCSAACINVFHPLLKFGRGTITAVLPSIALPSALSYFKTDTVLTNEVLVLKMDCPLCYHLKFLAIQMYGGLAFPCLIGIVSTSEGHGVPCNKTDTREYWKKSFRIAQAGMSTFQRVLFVQIITAFLIPYIQSSEITKVMKKINDSSVGEASEETA